jgi:molecular chaperone GrpE (heat shock protein)
MSDSSNQTPPRGDFEKAERYINQLVGLLNQNKIEAFRTDLKKFDPTTLHDHYSVSLRDYQIELSHSKQPDSNKDSYVMIFNNLKQLSEGRGEKVILAYIYMTDSQFGKFKLVADRQIEQKRKAEEEKRFSEALAPIDELLREASGKAESVVYQASTEVNPLMQSFKSDFQNELKSSLDDTEGDNNEFPTSTRIHQL